MNKDQNIFVKLILEVGLVFLFSYAHAEVRSSIVTQGPVTDGVWHSSTGLLACCNTFHHGTPLRKGFTPKTAAPADLNLFVKWILACGLVFLFSYAHAEVRSSIVTQCPVTDGVWHYSTGLLAWCNTSPPGTTLRKGFTREEAAAAGLNFLASPACTYTDCRWDGIYFLNSIGTSSWKFNWYECDFDPRTSTPSMGKILSCLPPSVSNGSVCIGPID